MRKTVALAVAAGLPSAAAAQVTETSTILNSYSYQVGTETGAGSNAGGDVEIFRSNSSLGGISEMGLLLTGTLDTNGSFFFLHNGYCVGSCSISLTTNITFSLTNNGTAPVDLRFDSQITPGHLANSFLEQSSNSTARFDFEVSQVPPTQQGSLYAADGTAISLTPEVNTSDGMGFNGFVVDNNNPAWNVLDWSATTLSVALATIDPGMSANLYYRSTLTVATSQANCADPTLCESFQVAFGDPRNAGGVNTLSALSLFSSLFAPTVQNQPVSPAVGAIYDPFRVTYSFVPVNAPLPGQQPIIPPIQYDVNYPGRGGAVPEPGTWMLMLLGFFGIGALTRRRKPSATARA